MSVDMSISTENSVSRLIATVLALFALCGGAAEAQQFENLDRIAALDDDLLARRCGAQGGDVLGRKGRASGYQRHTDAPAHGLAFDHRRSQNRPGNLRNYGT